MQMQLYLQTTQFKAKIESFKRSLGGGEVMPDGTQVGGWVGGGGRAAAAWVVK